MSEGEKPRCSTKRHDSRFAQPKAAGRASAMDGVSESLTIRHIQETRTLLRVFLCLFKSHRFDEIKTDLILSLSGNYGSFQ